VTTTSMPSNTSQDWLAPSRSPVLLHEPWLPVWCDFLVSTKRLPRGGRAVEQHWSKTKARQELLHQLSSCAKLQAYMCCKDRPRDISDRALGSKCTVSCQFDLVVHQLQMDTYLIDRNEARTHGGHAVGTGTEVTMHPRLPAQQTSYGVNDVTLARVR
jgi:hypothetical protein